MSGATACEAMKVNQCASVPKESAGAIAFALTTSLPNQLEWENDRKGRSLPFF